MSSCRNRPAESMPPEAEAPEEVVSADFLQFHDRFLQDSSFQLEHILFPIEGVPSNPDSATLASGQFRWQKTDWAIHKAFDFENSDYERQFVPFDSNLIIERIVHKSGGYRSERRFSKSGEDWYLIYYASLNPVR